MEKRKEVFLLGFENDFDKNFIYLKSKSPKNAISFAKNVDKKVEGIKQNPKLFPTERYLYTKRRLYRFSLVMKSWKIIYKVTNSKLIFLGIIHTAQHPSKIKNLRTSL
ncbi:MAG: type II toxin-antitoxin system RelE/ParE family toxin [Chlorobi bacterium]|nr:type II toxin-antitoxin system RelE/ParE family toxin [Chlorobiota bacterium]